MPARDDESGEDTTFRKTGVERTKSLIRLKTTELALIEAVRE
jgi:hypothetical protein